MFARSETAPAPARRPGRRKRQYRRRCIWFPFTIRVHPPTACPTAGLPARRSAAGQFGWGEAT